MGRRPGKSMDMKEKILKAAFDLFLEKGYEGTTVRGIMSRAGGEIGLFYYYFQSKDAIFDQVQDRFFDHYRTEVENIVSDTRRDPNRGLINLFGFVTDSVRNFRENIPRKQHRSFYWALQERALILLEPYVRRILEIQKECGVEFPLDLDVTAIFLTNGMGNLLLHRDENWVIERTEDLRRCVGLVTGNDNSKRLFAVQPQESQEQSTGG